jgi:predicted DCC family thiol-disulfide oxidoreductase YuxK
MVFIDFCFNDKFVVFSFACLFLGFYIICFLLIPFILTIMKKKLVEDLFARWANNKVQVFGRSSTILFI